MRILIITDFYYRGGLETFLYNLIKSWQDEDEFNILCNEDNPSISFLKKNLNKKLINIISFNSIFSDFTINILKKKNNFIKFLYYIFIFPQLIIYFKIFFQKNKYEKLIVVNGGYPGSIYCRSSIISWGILNKKKSIFNIHNMARKINLKNFIFEFLIDFLITFYSSKVITVSNSCAKSIENRIFFKYSSKLDVIYNGLVDLNQKTNLIDDNDKNYLLMLATFEKRKGYDYLFKALKHLKKTNPQITTKIYGDGNAKQYKRVKMQIKHYDLEENVFLNKFAENSFQIIKNCKLMLVPSQADESFGYTIVEAMSLSKPIISTNTGGIPEVLENGVSGYVCSKTNPIAFSESIKELLNNDKKYKNFSINARKRYLAKFKASTMASTYREMLL